MNANDANILRFICCVVEYPYYNDGTLCNVHMQHKTYKVVSEWVIKFNGLFGYSGHRGPYSPYKPCNHNLYIGIIIFPHIDNTQ